MTVNTIMTSHIMMLRPDDPVRKGLEMMHNEHVRNLPVIHEDGRFMGLFGIRQVVDLLLPKAARIEGGLTDLSFMPDDMGDVYHRVVDVGDRPVAEFLQPREDLLICKPGTPIPEVLELLHQSFHTSLPVLVLDDDATTLVGMVSGWDVLEKLVMNVFNNKGSDAR
jgi:CBS domain-containing protein